MKSYIIRIISTHSNTGKTLIATRLVTRLKNKGYRIGVIKHCAHGLDIEDKDTHKYLASGADIVIASSPNLGVIYYRNWVDSLNNGIKYIGIPIVIVEGFKEIDVGDVIVVAESMNEIEMISNTPNIIAYVVKNRDKCGKIYEGKPIYTFDEDNAIAELIENKVLEYILSQLPRVNCRNCGYESCQAFAKAYIKGETMWCPLDSEVILVVNDIQIQLNPYIKKLLKSILLAFIDTLKDVPKDKRKIYIEIKLE